MPEAADAPARKTIRRLARAIDLVLLAGIVVAFAFEIWIAVVLFLVRYKLGSVIPIVLLGPFYGVDAVREAVLGGMVLEGPQRRRPPVAAPEELVGSSGLASTELEYEGYVVVGDRRYPARADRPLPAGADVTVVGTRLGMLLVAPRRSGPERAGETAEA